MHEASHIAKVLFGTSLLGCFCGLASAVFYIAGFDVFRSPDTAMAAVLLFVLGACVLPYYLLLGLLYFTPSVIVAMVSARSFDGLDRRIHASIGLLVSSLMAYFAFRLSQTGIRPLGFGAHPGIITAFQVALPAGTIAAFYLAQPSRRAIDADNQTTPP